MSRNWKCLYYGFVCVILCTSATAIGQNDGTDSLSKAFAVHETAHYKEKIFVHTDKSFYVTGEILWFKLYLVDAVSNRPADISKVAYVEIADEENTPVLQAKISMEEGKGNGSFVIPSSVAGGTYVLRAYTGWMKNFGAELYFTKPVTIVNTLKKPQWKQNDSAAGYSLGLFPEGGNLVNGLQSTVAFKLMDKFGKGEACSGAVINAENDTVARLESFKFGMGTFQLVPDKNDQYRVVVRTEDDRVVTTDLPAIQDKGYVMHLSPESTTEILVHVLGKAQGEAPEIFLLVHSKGQINIARRATLQNDKALFSINKSLLGEGLSYFTIFDGNRQPVCERLYFKQPQKQLTIQLSAERKELLMRERIDLKLQAFDSINIPSKANMSVSVFLIDSLQKMEPDNIAHYFWLTSELKGLVESPGYYFNKNGWKHYIAV